MIHIFVDSLPLGTITHWDFLSFPFLHLFLSSVFVNRIQAYFTEYSSMFFKFKWPFLIFKNYTKLFFLLSSLLLRFLRNSYFTIFPREGYRLSCCPYHVSLAQLWEMETFLWLNLWRSYTLISIAALCAHGLFHHFSYCVQIKWRGGED